MIEILPGGSGPILAFRLYGKLTEADYRDVLTPEIDRVLKIHPKIRILFTLEHFDGWTVGGAWEDFTFALKLPSVERMAMVVDDSWDDWMTWIFRGFTTLTRTELRFFRTDRSQEAWDWIRTP